MVYHHVSDTWVRDSYVNAAQRFLKTLMTRTDSSWDVSFEYQQAASTSFREKWLCEFKSWRLEVCGSSVIDSDARPAGVCYEWLIP